MEYSKEEKKAIENARSIILRGNDIESAALILEEVFLNGMPIECCENILKIAVRQIINFIEEYKNKGYLDVVREKVSANEENRKKEELIEKQQKEIEDINSKYIDQVKYGNKITLIGNEVIPNVIDILKNNYIPKEAIREKIEYYKKQNNELDDFTCEIDALEELLGE